MGTGDVCLVLWPLRAPPAHSRPRTMLPNHNSVYRTEVLRRVRIVPARPADARERAHGELVDEGYDLRIAPDTRIWHVNESRPGRVLGDNFYLGRAYGCARSAEWSLRGRKCLYAAAWPEVAASTATRFIRALHHTFGASGELPPAVLPAFLAASAHAAGEIRGYFTQEVPIDEEIELHEFHIAGRLGGRSPAAPWLAQAVQRCPSICRD